MTAALRMGAREWTLLIFLSVLWGGAFFLAAVAVKEIAPFTLAFLRMAISAVALALVAQTHRPRRLRATRASGRASPCSGSSVRQCRFR